MQRIRQLHRLVSLVLLYHFFHPDEVISARLFSDLADDMSQKDGMLSRWPAARLYNGDTGLPYREQWNGVEIRRVWRPSLRQASNIGRVLNALFMLLAWTWRAIFSRRAAREVVVVGYRSDPLNIGGYPLAFVSPR